LHRWVWLLLAPGVVAAAAVALLAGAESTCSSSDAVTIGFDVAVLVVAASLLATIVAAIALRLLWPLVTAVLLAILGYFLVVNVVGNCLS
jgi:hypothetical protein